MVRKVIGLIPIVGRGVCDLNRDRVPSVECVPRKDNWDKVIRFRADTDRVSESRKDGATAERNGCPMTQPAVGLGEEVEMAKKVSIRLIDDLDGASAAVETVRFGVDGADYAIDLSAHNARSLREALAPWVSKARKLRRVHRGTALAQKASSDLSLEESQVIRAWALANGHRVSVRGRIPLAVVAAYRNQSV